MSRKRMSVEMLRASGSRHYSKAELDAREAQEVKAPPVAHLDPPSYLPQVLSGKFRDLAAVLIRMGTLSAIDADGLARYLLAEANYLRVTSRLTSALNTGNLADADKLAAMQDRFFRQCRAAASDLGLTISARCGLELPAARREEAAGEGADLFGE